MIAVPVRFYKRDRATQLTRLLPLGSIDPTGYLKEGMCRQRRENDETEYKSIPTKEAEYASRLAKERSLCGHRQIAYVTYYGQSLGSSCSALFFLPLFSLLHPQALVTPVSYNTHPLSDYLGPNVKNIVDR